MGFLGGIFNKQPTQVPAAPVESADAEYSVEKLAKYLVDWKLVLPEGGGITYQYNGGSLHSVTDKLKLVVEQIDNLSKEEVKEAYEKAGLTAEEKSLIAHEIYDHKKESGQA